jgi:Ca2+-binding EF-hand superfamily protein
MEIISTTVARRAMLALIFSAAAAASPAAQGQRSMRFAAMDANNDGVITRKEWNGSDRSFQVHDWNGDGILSGEEVRPGGQRPGNSADAPFDSANREYPYNDWTARGFAALDHNRDNRIARDEWHFDLETFRRADHNRDGALSRSEFLGENNQDDDRGDRFDNLDSNGDGRISRAEWHGTAERFDALDDNRDGALTRAEVRGTTEPPPDLFTSVDANHDRRISRDEWHWSRASFDARDANRDGVLTQQEFAGESATPQSQAWTQGRDRGLIDGRQAGKEDRQLRNAWDLEGQRELETADAGYDARFGSKTDYQTGYREGFRSGYREGFGPKQAIGR